MAKPNFKLVKSSLPSPEDVLEAKLPNGITVLARSNFNSPSVSFGGYLPAGAIFESDEKLGLADFVAASLMRGTQTRTFDEIYNELESVGASMGFDSGVHNTNFGGRALVEDLPLLLQLLAESLQTPVFPADEIERLRTQLLTGLALRAQDTAEMADLIFEQMLYRKHPYGRPTDGFVETIQSIARSEMKEFHRLHYGPRGLVIAIVGAIHPKKAVEEVERYLGGWQVPGQKEAPPLPPLRLSARQRNVTTR
ncbi:MAG: insulinase family protein [Chloroflexi bacterium]|nr:insulinase family protein [Chloroflexota bacterium]